MGSVFVRVYALILIVKQPEKEKIQIHAVSGSSFSALTGA